MRTAITQSSLRVDAFSQGWDRGVVGFGWFEPHFVSPMPFLFPTGILIATAGQDSHRVTQSNVYRVSRTGPTSTTHTRWQSSKIFIMPLHRSTLLAAFLALATASEAHTQSPKVLIIGLDGVRADALREANTPAIDSLIATGAVSWRAFAGGALDAADPTHQATSSGPGWTSILTGVWKDKHGVVDNSFAGQNLANFPHMFAHIRAAKPNAVLASIVHWAPINVQLLAPFPGLADFTRQVVTDGAVAANARAYLSSADPDVMFVHFDDCDYAGHALGFSRGVPSYITAIEQTDVYIDGVLTEMRARPNFGSEDWLVLVTTDHGGNRTSHGGHTPSEREIWIVANGTEIENVEVPLGPGHTVIPHNVLHHLGIPVKPAWGLADAEPFGVARTTTSAPRPENNATQAPTRGMLRFMPGADVTQHNVYLGLTPTLTAAHLVGNTTGREFDPGLLQPSMRYFWRVDTVTATSTQTGPVWSFTTAGSILDDLVVHLDMQGDTVDASLQGNDGTRVGTTAFVLGVDGEALSFPGTGHVNLGNPTALQFGANMDFSISVWIRSNGWSGDPVFLANKNWASGTNVGWILAGDDDGRNWQWNYRGSLGARIDYDIGGDIADGAWHHLVVVHDRDGDVTFYQDGARRTSGSIANMGTVDAGLPTAIGQDGTLNYSLPLPADVDEVRIWRRTLGNHEVEALYGAGPDQPWNHLVGGSFGQLGVPTLRGTGTLTANAPTSILLTNAQPSSIAALILGLSPQNLPLFGALVVPQVDVSLLISTDAAGAGNYGFPWPPGVPAGTRLWGQCAVLDATQSFGVAVSNAVIATSF